MNYKKEPPSYEQALIALQNGDDETVADALFALEIDDDYYIEKVSAAVRSLLQRKDLTPRQIMSIGRALHGLSRMPLRTPGLYIHISLTMKGKQSAQSYDLFIGQNYFGTESSGYADFGFGFGTDSFSGNTFAVETNSHRYDGMSVGIESWPGVFSEMKAADLEIEDESDDEFLDWDHPNGDRFWKWIEEHE